MGTTQNTRGTRIYLLKNVSPSWSLQSRTFSLLNDKSNHWFVFLMLFDNSFRLFRNSVFFCIVWKKVFSKFFSQTSFFERSVLRNIESAHFFLRAGGGADGGAREPESLTFDEVAPDYAEMALLHQTSKRVESEKAEYNVKSVLSLDTLNGPWGQISHSAQWKLNAGVTQDVRHWNEI